MDKKQRLAVIEMWASMRASGDMVADAPARKIGMPMAAPYEISFPVEEDGHLVFVCLDLDQVRRFAHGLLAALPIAREMEQELEAEYLAFSAVSKAKESV